MWTALAVPAAAQTIVQVTDDIGQDAVWASDNTHVLNGFVFVDDGAALTIEPGTVVRGKPGQAENASALIVAQGGKIFAAGTREEPIIFTAEADDVSDPFDLPLGKAVINTSTGAGAIEGIPTTEPAAPTAAPTATTPSTSTRAGGATTSSGAPCRPRKSATGPGSTRRHRSRGRPPLLHSADLERHLHRPARDRGSG